jgi:hypothetical protein
MSYEQWKEGHRKHAEEVAERRKKKMQAKNRCTELHVYPLGGHGFVCRFLSEYRGQALDDLSNWLRNRKQE